MKLEYSSNNSGGNWWLDDEDWKALEAAGWDVDWYAQRDDAKLFYKGGRFLGALASRAFKMVANKAEATEAIEQFERVTGSFVTDQGCNCCGQPHYFSLYDDDDNYMSTFDVEPQYTQYRRDWS